MSKRKVPEAFKAAAARAKAMTPTERAAWAAKMQAARAAKKRSGTSKPRKSKSKPAHPHHARLFTDAEKRAAKKLGAIPHPKHCPSCGANNAPTNKKCSSCGNSMKKAAALKDPWHQVHSTVRRPIKPARLGTGTSHQTHQNDQGLTYLEWLQAAQMPPGGLAHAAWRRGEDPSDHRNDQFLKFLGGG